MHRWAKTMLLTTMLSALVDDRYPQATSIRTRQQFRHPPNIAPAASHNGTIHGFCVLFQEKTHNKRPVQQIKTLMMYKSFKSTVNSDNWPRMTSFEWLHWKHTVDIKIAMQRILEHTYLMRTSTQFGGDHLLLKILTPLRLPKSVHQHPFVAIVLIVVLATQLTSRLV